MRQLYVCGSVYFILILSCCYNYLFWILACIIWRYCKCCYCFYCCCRRYFGVIVIYAIDSSASLCITLFILRLLSKKNKKFWTYFQQ